jgi:thiol oxidase
MKQQHLNDEDIVDQIFYHIAMLMKPIPIFRADLEQAIAKTLGHEVVQKEVISGESLAALRNFVSVLSRFYDFGNRVSYKKLLDYLMEPSLTEVKGNDLQSFLFKLNPPIVRKSRFIGCFSKKKGLRRFPCSLWTLFHHLTVQHLESENNEDPLDVLRTMFGYIKHFFGCTGCSKHFQEMAEKNHMWDVTSKDQAVLWLWSAHNEVNQRLAGDVTEDSNHPKIPFPAVGQCHECHKKTVDFDKTEVLSFLRRHYGNVNDMGIQQ